MRCTVSPATTVNGRNGTTNPAVCSVAGGGQNPCHGDSGGAIYRIDASLLPDSVVPVSVVGIVSFGNGCALEGYPEIFTNVRSYAGFINETISTPTVTATNPTEPVEPADPTDIDSEIVPVASLDNTESKSGCSISAANADDPLLPLLLLVSLCFLARASLARRMTVITARPKN